MYLAGEEPRDSNYYFKAIELIKNHIRALETFCEKPGNYQFLALWVQLRKASIRLGEDNDYWEASFGSSNEEMAKENVIAAKKVCFDWFDQLIILAQKRSIHPLLKTFSPERLFAFTYQSYIDMVREEAREKEEGLEVSPRTANFHFF